MQPGKVYLVGAGPGDPELITLKAMGVIKEADVIVYDNLVTKSILNHAKDDATLIYSGKRQNEHTMRQEQINNLLINLAREEKRVVRLKGGDPFIFGRGGEEMQALSSESIPYEVIPGVTAACGVSTYAGIPLTHRAHAQSVLFVTGHLKEGNEAELDWEALGRPNQTVVIYMGLNAVPSICKNLLLHGVPSSKPIAAVQHGTIASQKIIVGTVGDLPRKVALSKLQSPTLIILGDVVKLHSELDWFRATLPIEAHEFSGTHATLDQLVDSSDIVF